MRDREAFKFRYTLFFYNMILVVMNFHIFYQVMIYYCVKMDILPY